MERRNFDISSSEEYSDSSTESEVCHKLWKMSPKKKQYENINIDVVNNFIIIYGNNYEFQPIYIMMNERDSLESIRIIIEK